VCVRSVIYRIEMPSESVVVSWTAKRAVMLEGEEAASCDKALIQRIGIPCEDGRHPTADIEMHIYYSIYRRVERSRVCEKSSVSVCVDICVSV